MASVVLAGVADSSAARCAEVAAFCGVPAFEDFRTLVSRVDAAIVVVPTFAHFEVASVFLQAGKPVLVEKPLTAEPGQAATLVDLARRRGVVMQVGHIERFNPVLRAIPQHDQPPRLIEVRRVGPYSFRSTDISVVFDLMIHDLDIVMSIVGEVPDRIEASGWSAFGGLEDVVTARLGFPSGTVATLTASRADVTPRREMTLRWTHAVAHLDFANQRSIASMPTPAFSLVGTRFANPPPQQIPSLREGLHGHYFDVSEKDWSGGPELLAVELEHFIQCVVEGKEPLVNGERGRLAVDVADRVQRALRGEPTIGLARAA
jgi:predicted dehydrogenase